MSLSLLSVNNDIYNICFFISLLPFPWEYHTWSSNPNLIPLSSTYLYSNLSTSSSRLYTFSSIHPITSISTLYLTYILIYQPWEPPHPLQFTYWVGGLMVEPACASLSVEHLKVLMVEHLKVLSSPLLSLSSPSPLDGGLISRACYAPCRTFWSSEKSGQSSPCRTLWSSEKSLTI